MTDRPHSFQIGQRAVFVPRFGAWGAHRSGQLCTIVERIAPEHIRLRGNEWRIRFDDGTITYTVRTSELRPLGTSPEAK